MAKFSIIIPLYNKERDIAKTLNSIFLQTYTNYEVVVVNDGSTDSSEDVVKSFADSRVRFFRKENEGVSKTRNLGVSKANADHVVFLDADDYWYPNHLENLEILIAKFPDNPWYATAYEKKHYKKLIAPMISPILEKGKDWMGLVPNYFENSLVDSLAWTSAVCFKKSFFERLEGFDATLTHGEDVDLWIRAALEAPLAFSNTISARYNLDGSNRTSDVPTLRKSFINIDTYEKFAKSHPGLKNYLDLNRFSIAIQHKMAGDPKSFESFRSKINLKNLTTKQRYMLKQPKQMLQVLLKGKALAERLGLRLTSFK